MREIEARVLADRGGVYSASVKAFDNGYTLRFETSKGLEALTLQRGGDRVFKTLDAVAVLLRSLGVSMLSVDLGSVSAVSYTHLRAHETVLDLVCRLLLEKKKTSTTKKIIN